MHRKRKGKKPPILRSLLGRMRGEGVSVDVRKVHSCLDPCLIAQKFSAILFSPLSLFIPEEETAGLGDGVSRVNSLLLLEANSKSIVVSM